MDLHLGDSALYVLIHLHPKLAGEGLCLGIRSPVVLGVLILASQLAVIAAAAAGNIYGKNFGQNIILLYLNRS